MVCYLRQALQVSQIATGDQQLHLAALRRVAGIVRELDMELTPPENSVPVYEAIAEITSCADPYLKLKKQSNRNALAMLPECEKKIAASDEPLLTALRFAIGGNIIDYGAMHSFDVDSAMERCLSAAFAVDHSAELLQKVCRFGKNCRVLYLADNSGEIVYDSLVVRQLAAMGLAVTVAVKSGPIINDALLADAMDCGLQNVARIIENGTSCPGTPLNSCSEELQHEFNEADLIISKGQGNFETLSEVDAEVFFLLTIKCSVVGAHLAQICGASVETLSGAGELVLFYHKGNNQTDA